MKNKIKGYAVLTTAALASLVLTGCNEAKKIDKLLADGDCSEALDFYEEKNLSAKEEEKLSGKLKDRLDVTLKGYAAGEVKYKTAQKLVETIVKMDIETLSDESADAIEKLTTLKVSKDAFDEAKTQYEAGAKMIAYKLYSNVISDDCNYEAAQSKMKEIKTEYVAELSKKADEYIANGNYANAINLVKNALDESGMPELEKELDRVLNAYKQNIYEKADRFVENNDFYNATGAVEHVLNYTYWRESDLADFQKKIESIKEAEKIAKYNEAKKNITDQVNWYLENKNYESAYKMLTEFMETYKDLYEKDEECKLYVQKTDDDFYAYMTTLAEKYKAENLFAGLKEIYDEAKKVRPLEAFDKYFEKLLNGAPAYLTDAEIVSDKNISILGVDKDVVKGSDETEYLPCRSRFVMNATAADSWSSEEPADVMFDLKGEYTTLKGLVSTIDATIETLTNPDTGEEYKHSAENGKLEFFNDNEELILTVDINGLDANKEVELNVKDVQKLHVRFTVTSDSMGLLMKDFVLGKEQIA